MLLYFDFNRKSEIKNPRFQLRKRGFLVFSTMINNSLSRFFLHVRESHFGVRPNLSNLPKHQLFERLGDAFITFKIVN